MPVKEGNVELITLPEPEVPWWLSLLPTIAIIAIFALFWFFFIQQAQGGGGGAGKAMSFGKSKAKMSTEKDKTVTFADVAGADEEKEELQEVVDFLKDLKSMLILELEIPKGVFACRTAGYR